MFNITNIRRVLTSLQARIIALSAVAAAGLALAAAAPAGAEPPSSGPPVIKGYCPVEDQYGNVTYVKAGTRFGMFVCGVDGNWHWGWLING